MKVTKSKYICLIAMIAMVLSSCSVSRHLPENAYLLNEVKVVSELLGHSNTKITENIYIHVIQHQRVKAIQSIDKYSD